MYSIDTLDLCLIESHQLHLNTYNVSSKHRLQSGYFLPKLTNETNIWILEQNIYNVPGTKELLNGKPNVRIFTDLIFYMFQSKKSPCLSSLIALYLLH